MAHFAEINENNIVIRVIVVNNNELLDGEQESETKGIDFCESLYGHRNWVQTSYNSNIRYNYAGIGYTYDSIKDAFIPPKPYDSWVLNEDSCLWDPPVNYPNDGNEYIWNEENKSWDLITE